MISVARRTCLPLATVLLSAAGCKRTPLAAQTQMVVEPRGPFECKPPPTQEGYVPEAATLPSDGSPSKGHLVVTLDPGAGTIVPMRDPVVVFADPVGSCEPVTSTPAGTQPPTDPTPVGTSQGQMGQGGLPGQGQGQAGPGQLGQRQGQVAGGGTAVIPAPHIHQATQDVPGSTGGGTMLLAGSAMVARVPFHNAAYSGSKFQRDKSLLVHNEGGRLRAYVTKMGTGEKVHYVGEAQACPGTTGKGTYRIVPKHACIVRYQENAGGGGTLPPAQGQVTPPAQGQVTPPAGTIIVTPQPVGPLPGKPGQLPPAQGQTTPSGPGPFPPPTQGGGGLISKGAGYVWYPDVLVPFPGRPPSGAKRPPTDPTPGKAPAKQPAKQPAPVVVPVKTTMPSKQPLPTRTAAPDGPLFTKSGAPASKPPSQPSQPSRPIFTK